jgi:predicted transcriptional regulator
MQKLAFDRGRFCALVNEELRKSNADDLEVAKQANIPIKVVHNVQGGKADLCRREELKRLVKVLFLYKNKKREEMLRLAQAISPKRNRYSSVRRFHLHRRSGAYMH